MQRSRNSNAFVWNVPEEKIPFEYFDTVLSTIKNIINEPKGISEFNSYNFDYIIDDGSYHPVDSSHSSYEIATFIAISNIINFHHEKINSYK